MRDRKTVLAMASAAGLLFAVLGLTGCSTIPQSTAMPVDVREQGLVLKQALPAILPKESKRLSSSQLVLVPTESAAGMVVPLPFVSELIESGYHSYEASSFAARYASLDVFELVRQAMAGSPVLKAGAGKIPLFPVAYLVHCDDAVYRVALSGRIEDGAWTGRYTVHLPTALPESELGAGAAATIATLKSELNDAATILRQLLERDAGGTLGAAQYRADIGSMHLNCSKVAGLISPSLLPARGAEILEDGPDHLIVRIAGDLSQPGPAGGLMYGVHYLRKDQIHTLNRQP